LQILPRPGGSADDIPLSGPEISLQQPSIQIRPQSKQHNVTFTQTLFAADPAAPTQSHRPPPSSNTQRNFTQKTETAVHIHAARNPHRRQHVYAPDHISPTRLPRNEGCAKLAAVESLEFEAAEPGRRRGRPARAVQGEVRPGMGCGSKDWTRSR
jgi:hypothetical protein